ncbi:tryptophan synthase subunit alpha [Pedobacter psychrophilus]|uniref:Tryptophan synthase alpha chain n=1 Tax=Pedobacter psychrophilus TaxID=1826909 RepID=A0A179DG72_9SPHI|nr:tryptophan synthase subunit alpha [Pedobacter psychrophilus]OAQ39884.1 tryptophan synthase subunit alpha [Pedobacter psychrophilus]
MNRLQQLFEKKKNNILSIYFTAGYPEIGATLKIAEALEKAGADFLEIGFPYSDPLADGPIIQNSSQVAIENGMTLKLLFQQLKDLRAKVSIPVLLMGYANPMLQYGVANFCKAAADVGIDGVIVPDLPLYEYEEIYKNDFIDNGLSNVFLVTPQTSNERIKKIDGLSNGFIYLLSSSATTGKSLDVSDEIGAYYDRVKSLNLENPLIIGFGISDKNSFMRASKYANGAIVGSAFVKTIGDTKDYLSHIPEFIRKIRD